MGVLSAKELRIGNYVYDKFDLLVEFDINCFIMYLQGYYKPIPLTEKWLLDFGFKENKNKWFDINYFTDCEENAEVICISYNISSQRLAVYDAIEETDMLNILSYQIYTAKIIKHVHQLQNLYFALTGKELTLKN